MENSQLKIFLSELAGPGATPGGGSAAALLGAMGAALVSMVCNLTLGKKAYVDVQEQAAALLKESETLRGRLVDVINEDIRAFRAVMAAYRMPAGTEIERTARAPALQMALRQAIEAPLECAVAAARVLELAEVAARIGNRNVISDAGVGALSAQAALQSAAINVQINLANLEDKAFARESERRLAALLDGSEERLQRTLELVRARL